MTLEAEVEKWNNQQANLQAILKEERTKRVALEKQNADLKDTTVIGEKEKEIEIMKEVKQNIYYNVYEYNVCQ